MYESDYEYHPSPITVAAICVIFTLMMILVVGVTAWIAYEVCFGVDLIGGYVPFFWLIFAPCFTFCVGAAVAYELKQ